MLSPSGCRVGWTARACPFLLLAVVAIAPLRAFAQGDQSAGLKKKAPSLSQQDVFISGQGGYHTYRIPSILTTPKGTVLALCEGRKGSTSDSGDIDVVMRRSLDGGASWSPLQVLADAGPHTMGNPSPVFDRETGILWLLLTRNHGDDKEAQIIAQKSKESRTVWVMQSRDEGETWTKPEEITSQVKLPNWTWYATGPGVSIQLKGGRLVIPCDHFVAGSKSSRSHVIYSDDHGKSWRIGGVAGERVNECQVVELPDESLLINMRNQPPRRGDGRAIAISTDQGMSWTPPTIDPTLIEPGCQASLISILDAQGLPSAKLLFSNPASAKREAMTVRLSLDGGRTWPHALALHAGPSAYSCLTVLKRGVVGCLYERGSKTPYERITLARFPLDDL